MTLYSGLPFKAEDNWKMLERALSCMDITCVSAGESKKIRKKKRNVRIALRRIKDQIPSGYTSIFSIYAQQIVNLSASAYLKLYYSHIHGQLSFITPLLLQTPINLYGGGAATSNCNHFLWAPSFLNLRVVGFPFSTEKMNIDEDKASDLIVRTKPKVIIFGASRILFPHPVQRLTRLAEDIGACVWFDASHVMGLIAGGQFQSPLQEGASALFGSTHKSFFGPQGGIILADKEHGEIIKQRIFPAYVDNAHWNRIAALTLALAEMREFGKAYAEQTVKNAQALAKTLAESNFPVVGSNFGFTKSHQIFLDYGGYKKGREVAEKLEKANIIVDCGVRLGVCELTRRGMEEKEMQKVAELMERTVNAGEEPKEVKHEVAKFVGEFPKIQYCFE